MLRLSLGLGLSAAGGGAAPAFDFATLFAGGEKGGWFDPNTASCLFQDTAGTVAVTTATDPVGRWNATNGTFTPLLQATAGFRPLYGVAGNGAKYVDFDATDDTLASASQTFNTTDESTIIVGIKFDTSVANGILAGIRAGSGNSTSLQRGGTPATGRIEMISSGSVYPTDRAQADGYTGVQTLVVTGRGKIATDLSEIYVNGTLIDTGAGDQGTGNLGSGVMTMGKLFGSSIDGQVYGALVINRLISAGEQASVEAYLATKLGI